MFPPNAEAEQNSAFQRPRSAIAPAIIGNSTAKRKNKVTAPQSLAMGESRRENKNRHHRSRSGILVEERKDTMNLDEAQKQKVTAWIERGLKLSEIQSK